MVSLRGFSPHSTGFTSCTFSVDPALARLDRAGQLRTPRGGQVEDLS